MQKSNTNVVFKVFHSFRTTFHSTEFKKAIIPPLLPFISIPAQFHYSWCYQERHPFSPIYFSTSSPHFSSFSPSIETGNCRFHVLPILENLRQKMERRLEIKKRRRKKLNKSQWFHTIRFVFPYLNDFRFPLFRSYAGIHPKNIPKKC